jgi:hypothetical protein
VNRVFRICFKPRRLTGLSATVAVIVGCAWLCLAGTGWAGTGLGDSATAIIDTRPPVLTVGNPPDHTVLRWGESIDLGWDLSEDYPGLGPDDHLAQIWFGELLWASQVFGANAGPHLWSWTVPDTTSATVHLVVRSRDAFGNLTVATGDNFTILSTATAVPLPASAAVFAQPVPNPFNPLTELRFNLPQDGPVTVTVHDARGFRVQTLLQSNRAAGDLRLRWHGTDDAGRRQAGGTYFFRLTYGDRGGTRQIVRKAVLLP